MSPWTLGSDNQFSYDVLQHLDVIVFDQASTITAAVVFVDRELKTRVFIRGSMADSAEQAMHKLLETTMVMVGHFSRDIFADGDLRGAVNGGYWYSHQSSY